MIASAFWMAKQLSDGYEIAPLTQRGVTKLEASAERISRALSRHGADNLPQLLERLGRRSNAAMMLVNMDNKKFIYGFPRPLRPEKGPFMQLLTQTSPLKVRTPIGPFFGPIELMVNDQPHKLFVGDKLRPGFVQQIRHRHPGIFIASALFVSGLLCALLAWSLVSPLQQLRKAAKQMASGDLGARVGSASQRGDEIGQLGEDFNIMATQVESAAQRQKRLLADISHELRSPLARLQVAIGIADQESSATNTPLHGQLPRIEKEARQIDKMLEQLLQLSKLEGIQQVPEKQSFDFQELIHGLVDDAQYEANAAGKQVSLEFDQKVSVSGDPQLLSSAIGNVLSNAVKYCSTKVQVKVSIEESTIRINVMDDGEGVPEDLLNEIFTPFYRLSASRTRKSGGVGLGLAIAKQAVLTHNGQISAVNDGLGGLNVTISLPLES